MLRAEALARIPAVGLSEATRTMSRLREPEEAASATVSKSEPAPEPRMANRVRRGEVGELSLAREAEVERPVSSGRMWMAVPAASRAERSSGLRVAMV